MQSFLSMIALNGLNLVVFEKKKSCFCKQRKKCNHKNRKLQLQLADLCDMIIV